MDTNCISFCSRFAMDERRTIKFERSMPATILKRATLLHYYEPFNHLDLPYTAACRSEFVK